MGSVPFGVSLELEDVSVVYCSSYLLEKYLDRLFGCFDSNKAYSLGNAVVVVVVVVVVGINQCLNLYCLS